VTDTEPIDLLPLGTWPTPLEPAPRLSAALGLEPDDLWIKHDDLIGLGGGGNKVRKLQYTCAAALASGATTLITTGAAQSNHARQTAAAGARLGLDVVLVLAGEAGTPRTGNLVLDGLFGASIRWAGGTDDLVLVQHAEEVAAELREQGTTAAIIPFGGSSVEGARGYVDCGEELIAQDPTLEHVVVALGSGGTMAGLVHALGTEPVIGVHTGAVPDPHRAVHELLDGLTGTDSASASASDELNIRMDQVGPGYHHLTDQVREALLLAARTEGIVLDPIYTGRALAGLRAAVEEGSIQPGERTVFVHTGGLPGFFGNADTVAFAAAELDGL
jgi:L-cysteate sulfo-lyase